MVEGDRLDVVEGDGRGRILDHRSLVWKRLGAEQLSLGEEVMPGVHGRVVGSGVLVKGRRGVLGEL